MAAKSRENDSDHSFREPHWLQRFIKLRFKNAQEQVLNGWIGIEGQG